MKMSEPSKVSVEIIRESMVMRQTIPINYSLQKTREMEGVAVLHTFTPSSEGRGEERVCVCMLEVRGGTELAEGFHSHCHGAADPNHAALGSHGNGKRMNE
ncbi:hypothetical protein SRHO_G00110630 [Serrasalmus rhombeus]